MLWTKLKWKNNSQKKFSGIKILEKKVGQTPLQVLDEYKKENLKYKSVKMAYAGRLDPMAEGKLLVLLGETCKKRKKYLDLDKEYEFEILLNFKSDSQDVLGMADFASQNPPYKKTRIQIKIKNKFKGIFSEEEIPLKNILNKFLGKQKFEYPIFSSKTVQGKPLFLWALENKISEISIPKKEVKIYQLKFLQERIVKKEILEKEIFEKINSFPEVKEKSKELGADFRRTKIRQRWQNIFSGIKIEQKFVILKIKCICSSGTYMRVLAEKIAQDLDYFGLAFAIKRTKIGRYKKIPFTKFGFWIKKY